MVTPNSPSSSQAIIDKFLTGGFSTQSTANPYAVQVTPYTPPADPTIPDCGALYPNENRIYDPLTQSCVIVPEEEISNDNDRTPFVKNITDGVIDGYERVLSDSPIGMNGALNSREMMALENRFGPEMASQMGLMNQEYLGRGIQYNPITGRYIAASPTGPKIYPFDEMTFGTALGDARRALGSMFGGLKNYATQGGLLGMLLGSKQSPEPVPNYTKNPFIPPVITNDNITQQNIPSLEQQQLIDDVLKSNNNDNKNNNSKSQGSPTQRNKPKNIFTREYNQSKQGNPFERNV